MARPLRLHVPGIAAHVLSRGNDKECIFTDSVDYSKYEELLEHALQRFAVTCHGWCLLWNHLHLIVRPSTFPLCGMMQQLNSNYCQWFNKRHGRVGHRLQGRYKALLIEDGSYFLNAIRYVALNPVVAQKVPDPTDWPWSSYRASIGRETAPAFLDLEPVWAVLDAATPQEGRERLQMLVTAGGRPEELWGPLIRGSAAFAKRIDPLLEPHRENDDFLYAERFATRPSLRELFAGVAGGPPLEDAVQTAFCRHVYTLKAIANELKVHPSTVWVWVRRSESRRRQ